MTELSVLQVRVGPCEYLETERCERAAEIKRGAAVGNHDSVEYRDEVCTGSGKYYCDIRQKLLGEKR